MPAEDLGGELDGEDSAAAGGVGVSGGGAGHGEGGGDGQEGCGGRKGGEGFAVRDRGLQNYPVNRWGGREAGHHVEDVLTA